jgi:hypothetical protein
MADAFSATTDPETVAPTVLVGAESSLPQATATNATTHKVMATRTPATYRNHPLIWGN